MATPGAYASPTGPQASNPIPKPASFTSSPAAALDIASAPAQASLVASAPVEASDTANVEGAATGQEHASAQVAAASAPAPEQAAPSHVVETEHKRSKVMTIIMIVGLLLFLGVLIYMGYRYTRAAPVVGATPVAAPVMAAPVVAAPVAAPAPMATVGGGWGKKVKKALKGLKKVVRK